MLFRSEGTSVHNPSGDKIGSIDHLMIDKPSGKVAYAVMSFGGFLGLGEGHYPVPWGALKYQSQLGGFQTHITESQLKDSPEFTDQAWADRNWEKRTYDYYGVPYYW